MRRGAPSSASPLLHLCRVVVVCWFLVDCCCPPPSPCGALQLLRGHLGWRLNQASRAVGLKGLLCKIARTAMASLTGGATRWRGCNRLARCFACVNTTALACSLVNICVLLAKACIRTSLFCWSCLCSRSWRACCTWPARGPATPAFLAGATSECKHSAVGKVAPLVVLCVCWSCVAWCGLLVVAPFQCVVCCGAVWRLGPSLGTLSLSAATFWPCVPCPLPNDNSTNVQVPHQVLI